MNSEEDWEMRIEWRDEALGRLLQLALFLRVIESISTRPDLRNEIGKAKGQ